MGYSWIDDPLEVGVHPIKTVHMEEMQDNLNTERDKFGFDPISFTTSPEVEAVQIEELRQGINEMGDPAACSADNADVFDDHNTGVRAGANLAHNELVEQTHNNNLNSTVNDPHTPLPYYDYCDTYYEGHHGDHKLTYFDNDEDTYRSGYDEGVNDTNDTGICPVHHGWFWGGVDNTAETVLDSGEHLTYNEYEDEVHYSFYRGTVDITVHDSVNGTDESAYQTGHNPGFDWNALAGNDLSIRVGTCDAINSTVCSTHDWACGSHYNTWYINYDVSIDSGEDTGARTTYDVILYDEEE